jgi:hypothetical protein
MSMISEAMTRKRDRGRGSSGSSKSTSMERCLVWQQITTARVCAGVDHSWASSTLLTKANDDIALADDTSVPSDVFDFCETQAKGTGAEEIKKLAVTDDCERSRDFDE